MPDRVALITGGARGIGRAAALALAGAGWAVAICYRTSRGEALETVKAIEAHGVKGLCFEADVSDPDAASGLVGKVEAEWGRIDALVNCAGPYRKVGLLEETPEGWRGMFDDNLHHVFYMSRAVAPGMKERKWGRIVNFSVAGADRLGARTEITPYYIAKAGVLMLTRSLARVLARDGITVNAVSPGFIDSGNDILKDLEDVTRTIPAGRIGHTKDAASAVMYLLSDEASYVSGTNIIISGAWGL
ncbi:MAG TPA: SDR family oxidoreductase [Thermodesulfobacteriota bacterium]|nr:SDR family oxidoreductase [Thermodesulfobacteriota bacterium]